MKGEAYARLGRFSLFCGAAVSLLALSGCALHDLPILDPGGPVALRERDLIYFAVGIMMLAVIPVYALTIGFALKYRRGAKKPGEYMPDWDGSVKMDAIIWGGPAILVVIIGTMVWIETYKLDPQNKIADATRQVDVEAVSLDWKWVFFYPKEKIVVVNEMAMPVGANMTMHLTSDVAMAAFQVQGLGSQIFAMAGMNTTLNLKSDVARTYTGRNMQFTGKGFSGQHFSAPALSDKDYDAWVEKVRASGRVFDQAAYDALAKKAATSSVAYYSDGDFGLFDRIIQKYAAARALCEKPSDSAAAATH